MEISKSLIVVLTCNRLNEVKKHIWEYIDFCNKNHDYDFLLALDGKEQDYLIFCENFHIPLVFSDEREGVGISKNRVLKMFPHYEFYFFVEDDVELIDNSVFQDFVNVSREGGYPHLTANHYNKIYKRIIMGENHLEFAFFGGAYFNFFSAKGIKEVGGWNTCFAKYKRYGHTEHSYRFFHAGLMDAPFISLENAKKKLIVHSPPHVTIDDSQIEEESQLVLEEIELISQKTTFFSIQTLSTYYFNGFPLGANNVVGDFQENRKKYPLTKGKERRNALADHYFLRIQTTSNLALKIFWFFKSILFNPFNIPFKHFLKTKLLKYD